MMKVILDIDKKVLKNMQGYCDAQNVQLEKMLESLFNKYIQEPASIIDTLYANTGSLEELNSFAKILTDYLNEAALDIQSLGESEESYDSDRAIVEVFKRLNQEHIKQPFLLTDLFKTYWNYKVDNK